MSTILTKKENFNYSLKLNRPDKHNAFNPEMIEELTQFFKEVEKDKFTGAILISGSGNSFCSGGDLDWMKSMVNYSYEDNIADSEKLFAMYEAAYQCSLPIVGYLHGNVFGGGVGLAAICDVAIAEANTKFCFSEVKLGIAPAVISSFVLKKMNANKASELMLTGRIFDSATAQNAGLVEFSGRELEVKEYLNETLKQIRHAGPVAVRETKKLLRNISEVDSKKIKEKSIQLIAERRVSDEGQEGLKSFFEKRKPSWIWNVSDE